MPFNKEMDGRVAIITGAGRSIGRSMALELADAGCAVVVNVRTNRAEGEGVVKEIEKMGGRAMVAVADVIDPKAVNAMAEAALKKFGRIDYLVNNAALHPAETIDHHDLHTWRETFRVNVDGMLLCCQAALAPMRRQKKGAIVNMGSISGTRGLSGS